MVSAKVGNFVALRRLMISGVAEYSELTSGHAARGHSCSESVISYLKGGQLLVVSPGVVDDLLNPSRIYSGATTVICGAPDQAKKLEGMPEVRVVMLKGEGDSLAESKVAPLSAEALDKEIDATGQPVIEHRHDHHPGGQKTDVTRRLGHLQVRRALKQVAEED